MRAVFRSALPFAAAAFILGGAVVAQAMPTPVANDEANRRQPVLPIEMVVDTHVNPPQDRLDIALDYLHSTWTAIETGVGAAYVVARDTIAPLIGVAGKEASTAWTATTEAATPLLEEAADLTKDTRGVVAQMAERAHAKAEELRNHPVVEAAVDFGILMRIAEMLGVGAVVGGLVWRRLA